MSLPLTALPLGRLTRNPPRPLMRNARNLVLNFLPTARTHINCLVSRSTATVSVSSWNRLQGMEAPGNSQVGD